MEIILSTKVFAGLVFTGLVFLNLIPITTANYTNKLFMLLLVTFTVAIKAIFFVVGGTTQSPLLYSFPSALQILLSGMHCVGEQKQMLLKRQNS